MVEQTLNFLIGIFEAIIQNIGDFFDWARTPIGSLTLIVIGIGYIIIKKIDRLHKDLTDPDPSCGYCGDCPECWPKIEESLREIHSNKEN